MKPRSLLLALIGLAAFICQAFAAGESIDLTERLLFRNKMQMALNRVKPYLYDRDVLARLQDWMIQNENDHASYVTQCQFTLRSFFPAEKIIAPLCYFLRQDDLEKRKGALDLIENHLLEVEASLKELAEDPRLQNFHGSLSEKARKYLRTFSQKDMAQITKCFRPALNYNYAKDLADGKLNYNPFAGVSNCLTETFPKQSRIGGKLHFALNFEQEFSDPLPIHPGHSISPTGWIGGNQVSYLHQNDTSVDLTELLRSKAKLMPTHYPLRSKGSFDAFLRQDLKASFSEEGFYSSIDDHPVWSQKESTFGKILEAIRSAKETIFMDIFFLGGTMGASLAKELIQLLETRPGLKAFILRDNFNHFGHEKEMRPVFNYLLAYSSQHPDKLIIAAAYIKAHRSGLPKFLDPLITDQFLEKSGIQTHLALYGRAVADHSKTIVVDGTSQKPVAFVGSKNLTDGSGAVCFDDVIQVTGPAAAIVLDDYYEDMAASLRYEMSAEMVRHWAQNGWAKALFDPAQDRDTQIAAILRPFDLLEREASGRATRTTPVVLPSLGNSLVRTGLNSWDSSRTNVLDEIIQMIFLAKKNIYINDQLLFDRNTVLALLKAKAKNNALDIRIILEPLELATPKGMPNILYLDILHDAGIQIRWKRVRGDLTINQEFHMKTISIDGLSVIAGSANKDQSTMYGSFREEQLEVWDREATAVHDRVFEKRWNTTDPANEDATEEFKPYDFKVPADLKGLDGKPMSPKDFLELLRDVISVLYDAAKV